MSNFGGYYQFRNKINRFYKYYGVDIVSIDIVANNGDIAINLKLT